jgi:hypothetical protein
LTPLPWRESALEEAKRDLRRCDGENAKNDNVGNGEIRGALDHEAKALGGGDEFRSDKGGPAGAKTDAGCPS